MINKNKLKALIRKIGKRPSKEAVEKINKLLESKTIREFFDLFVIG